MSKINANLLKAKIMENGENQCSTAKAIGISANSLGRKINGKSEFTVSEIVGISKFLHIDRPCEIFLPSLSQICNDIKTA